MPRADITAQENRPRTVPTVRFASQTIGELFTACRRPWGRCSRSLQSRNFNFFLKSSNVRLIRSAPYRNFGEACRLPKSFVKFSRTCTGHTRWLGLLSR